MIHVSNVQVLGGKVHGYDTILTKEACLFLEELHNRFNEQQKKLLKMRIERQKEYDSGLLPKFRMGTEEIRNDEWSIAPIPDDIKDRRVEITGPSGNKKMVVNALNSGAMVFMADFEDANSPTWENCINGQLNLYHAIRRTIDFTSDNGKEYFLNKKIATIFARPRGLHLHEKHVLVNGEPISASLFDFGLYFFHNVKELLVRGSGPYFYLPKLEYYQEATFWSDVFHFAEEQMSIKSGTIKATVLIETLTAAFEANEILYELRSHSAGLNCGRWDYIFSFIKKLNKHHDCLLPDRSEVTMTTPFMRAYSLYVIQTCHKRGSHAMGGMAAQIPIKNDLAANERALEKVRKDKLREVTDGHDGTWVAHPALVPVALEVFDKHMPTSNQITRLRDDYHISADELVEMPTGVITLQGLRQNIIVAITYMEAWLRGQGAVPIFSLMEDVATAEISRIQVWQWINHPQGILNTGRNIDYELVMEILEEVMNEIQKHIGEYSFINSKFEIAKQLFVDMITCKELIEFMTIPAYEYLIKEESV